MSGVDVSYTRDAREVVRYDDLAEALSQACILSASGNRDVRVQALDGHTWFISATRYELDES